MKELILKQSILGETLLSMSTDSASDDFAQLEKKYQDLLKQNKKEEAEAIYEEMQRRIEKELHEARQSVVESDHGN